MRLCQSVRYTLGIYAICFLLNGISSAEDDAQEHSSLAASKSSIEPEGRALFMPRVDYNNQWTPVGHSDPLKNDPTFDYVPPTLGSVRYWSDDNNVNKRSNQNQTNKTSGKDEILLLGAPVEHSVNLQSNHLSQSEAKTANRRSSPHYPPEPARHLTPPSLNAYSSSYDQNVIPSDYNYHASSSNYWSNDLPMPHSSDSYTDESASYVTVIRPKTNPHPYSSTIYNKNVRNSIYHLAANVNSLEPVDKKLHWVHSLLQKEVTHQIQPTTPQVILAYSPHLYEPQPLKKSTNDNAFETTTAAPMSLTTDSLFSHYKQPSLPVRRPMYLTIQGYSKVKTYRPESGGSSANKTEKHEAKMVPVVAKDDPVVKHVVSVDSSGSEVQVKHLHKIQGNESKTKTGTSKPTKKVSNPMESLLSLLDTSLGGFAFNDKETKTKPNDQKKIHSRVTTISTVKPLTFLGPTTINPYTEQNS